MPEFYRARNVHTGAIASLPDSLLANLPDWVKDPGPAPELPKPKKNLRRTEASGSDEPATPDAVSAASTEKE